MSIADFLCYLREELIEAREDVQNSHEKLSQLLYTLITLDEASTQLGDTTYSQVIDDLINAIQHTELAEFKVTIPSEDTIRNL
jgi:hypothetical protein